MSCSWNCWLMKQDSEWWSWPQLHTAMFRSCWTFICVPAGHNSDGKFIARAQRIEFDCELIPRRVAIFIEKSKDGQVMPVPNVVVRDVACGGNHTVRKHSSLSWIQLNGWINQCFQWRLITARTNECPQHACVCVAGAGLSEASVQLGFRRLRASGPHRAEGWDGSSSGQTVWLSWTWCQSDLHRIPVLLRCQRDG